MRTPTLTPARRSELRNLLEARARELEHEVTEEMHAGDMPGIPNRAAETDQAIADLEASLEIAAVSRDLVELDEVRAALARIDDPGFGRCANCGRAISWARLEAVPHATECRACAAALEGSV